MFIKCCPLNLVQLQPIPMVNQFLPGFLQPRTDIDGNRPTIDHRLKVSQQVSPAELTAFVREVVIGRIAIAHHDTTETFAQQMVNLVTRTRWAAGPAHILRAFGKMGRIALGRVISYDRGINVRPQVPMEMLLWQPARISSSNFTSYSQPSRNSKIHDPQLTAFILS